MTYFKDPTGLRDMPAIKLAGASGWIGKSSSVVAIDTSERNGFCFSVTNISLCNATFDAASTSNAVQSAMICKILMCLHSAGIADVGYLGATGQAPQAM